MCAGIGLLLMAVIAACGADSAEDNSCVPSPGESAEIISTTCVQSDVSIVFEEPIDDPWTEEELYAVVLTLAGECYDDKEQDKRLVCEVILNRVSSAGFPDTIIDVLSYPNAFSGYWRQSREVTENDYEVATQALRDWYNGGCLPLSEYLFFSAGENRENVFREEF